MVKIFTDFDGTISKKDVGDELFLLFGGAVCQSYAEEYRKGLLSAVSCFRRGVEACGEFRRRDLDQFIAQQEIDPAAARFFGFCRDNCWDCYILSDGLDYYIEKILEANEITSVRYYANHLDLVSNDSNGCVFLKVSFPYTDEECDRCACCKRNIMLTKSADEDLIIYIGEGYSDRCPVRYADLIFAKDDLLRYCVQEKIPHTGYETFSDIMDYLHRIQQGKIPRWKKRFKKRRQAQLARRDVFIGG